MMLKQRLIMTITMLFLLLAGSINAQTDDGNGVITEANERTVAGISTLNPLRCNHPQCQRITDFLFPKLFAVDAVMGTIIPQEDDAAGLVKLWARSEDDQAYLFSLRDDAFWSDGQPITAYDVFFSYLAITSGDIGSPYQETLSRYVTGVIPVDASTIVFYFDEADCTALDNASIPIIPAHVFEPDFAEHASTFFNQAEPGLSQFEQWIKATEDYSFTYMNSHPFDDEPSVTGGLFNLDEIHPTSYIRLTRDEGQQAYNFIDPNRGETPTDLFLRGETNFIVDPPYIMWPDIEAVPGVQTFTYPGNTWFYIGLNFADPREPQDAFDEDGLPLEQGFHPIFADLQMRQALRLALDIDSMIEIAWLGHATAIRANMLPTSWAYNDSLPAITYDPVAAGRLLHDAGWDDLNGNGIRECVRCNNAPLATPLAFSLVIDGSTPTYRTIAFLIAENLQRVGIDVSVDTVDARTVQDVVSRQIFDAYLGIRTEHFPINPDQSAYFSQDEDIVLSGLNGTSYYNPELEELMIAARGVPGCDMEERADLYRQIQEIMDSDLPIIPLFVPHQMVAAQGEILNFDPVPHAPLWNITEWQVRP